VSFSWQSSCTSRSYRGSSSRPVSMYTSYILLLLLLLQLLVRVIQNYYYYDCYYDYACAHPGRAVALPLVQGLLITPREQVGVITTTTTTIRTRDEDYDWYRHGTDTCRSVMSGLSFVATPRHGTSGPCRGHVRYVQAPSLCRLSQAERSLTPSGEGATACADNCRNGCIGACCDGYHD